MYHVLYFFCPAFAFAWRTIVCGVLSQAVVTYGAPWWDPMLFLLESAHCSSIDTQSLLNLYIFHMGSKVVDVFNKMLWLLVLKKWLDHHFPRIGSCKTPDADSPCWFGVWLVFTCGVKVPCMSTNAANVLQLEQWLWIGHVYLCRCGQVLWNHTRCALHPNVPLLPWWWEGGWVLRYRSSKITRPSVAPHLSFLLLAHLHQD